MLAHMRQHAFERLTIVRGPLLRILPAHTGGIEHPAAKQWERLDRQKAGLVRPIFEQRAFSQQVGQPFLRISAQPAPQHQVRAARNDVDRIDLQDTHSTNRRQQIGLAGDSIGPAVQSLRGDHQRLGGGVGTDA